MRVRGLKQCMEAILFSRLLKNVTTEDINTDLWDHLRKG